jgi:hypothetical protein
MEEKSDEAKVDVFEPVAPAYYADEKQAIERPTCGPPSHLKRWGKWTWEGNFGLAVVFFICFAVFYGLWAGFMTNGFRLATELEACREDMPYYADLQLQSVRVFMKTLPQTPELSEVDTFIVNIIMGHLKSVIPTDQAPLQQLNELMAEKQAKTIEDAVAELQQTIRNFIKAQPTPIASRLGAIAYYSQPTDAPMLEDAANDSSNSAAF